jgi:hypothetical protein
MAVKVDGNGEQDQALFDPRRYGLSRLARNDDPEIAGATN